jgi:hypothetical protein
VLFSFEQAAQNVRSMVEEMQHGESTALHNFSNEISERVGPARGVARGFSGQFSIAKNHRAQAAASAQKLFRS